MAIEPDQAFEDAALVLDQALADDVAGVAGTLAEVVKGDGAYQVALCLAGAMAGDGLREGPWRLEFPGIDEADYDTRWVARFVSAYVNHDDLTGEALFGAAVADGKLPECLMTLAGSTAATLRRRSHS
ncbi:hypothetical protein [Allorhizocola rhizosphaerae]|uniref:hypothetical protein n=1 Tax=Allorhizocola rhizosphaerae TaxID=1872709 RepID=UPI000E3DB4F6|nr:hypothetical protein [Allorhizocola rhizosphaerae]